jgi:monooxygenase
VVIGSGATAVTLVPAMAERAAHVTMLQRSPSYVISIPTTDKLAGFLQKWLPGRLAHPAVRWKSILVTSGLYALSRRFPTGVRAVIRRLNQRLLPRSYPVDVHFKPAYDPWDQRMCLVPDADLFKAISAGTASVVTDTIETFTETGLRLGSGAELDADIVVTATGLRLLAFGGIALTVDGTEVKLKDTMTYRALMLADVPNFFFTIGYTNASWTLKADLVAEFVCRAVGRMRSTGQRVVLPRRDPTVAERPFMDFNPGYVLRALDKLPRQGSRAPWRLRQNYLHDARSIRRALDDEELTFG